MIRKFCWVSLAVVTLVGCDSGNTVTDNAKPPVTPTSDSKVAPGAPAEGVVTVPAIELSSVEKANIGQLPPEDAKLALEQKICPVTKEHLGDEAMGVPIKVTADGMTAFLCCDGCKADFEKDPKKYMAILKKAN